MFFINTRLPSNGDAAQGSAETGLVLFVLTFFISTGFFAGLAAFLVVALRAFNQRRSGKSLSSPVVRHMESVGTNVIISYRDHPSDLENQVSHIVLPIVPLPPLLISLPSDSPSTANNDAEGNGTFHALAATDDSENTAAPQVDGGW